MAQYGPFGCSIRWGPTAQHWQSVRVNGTEPGLHVRAAPMHWRLCLECRCTRDFLYVRNWQLWFCPFPAYVYPRPHIVGKEQTPQPVLALPVNTRVVFLERWTDLQHAEQAGSADAHKAEMVPARSELSRSLWILHVHLTLAFIQCPTRAHLMEPLDDVSHTLHAGPFGEDRVHCELL